jgi:opacity protein-like surface antigen
MFKGKIFIPLLLIVSFTTAFASQTTTNKGAGGFYSGITGGAISGYINAKSATYDEHDGSAGVVGSVIAGYNWPVSKKFHLALEAEYGLSNFHAENTYTFGPYYESFKLNSFAGVSLLPSVQFRDNVWPYIEVGYIQARTKTDDRGRTTVSRATTWKGGWQLGLGIRTALYKNIYLQFGHSYFFLNTIYIDNVSYKYRWSLFQLGIIYKF